MRIDVESFLALVVLIGGGAAVTAAVVTANDAGTTDDAVATEQLEPAADDAAATPSQPVIPRIAKQTPTKVVGTDEPIGTFQSTILEPVPDEDPATIPGPDVEGF
jgi:hypothetical protein